MTNHYVMRLAAGALIAFLLLSLPGAASRAQQPQVTRLVVSGVQDESGTGVASVTVLDPAGNPVTGLAQGSFTVQVDGQPAPVTAASSGLDAALPLGVILTIDTSGSMAEQGRLEAAKVAILPLVESLQPNDRMALVIFANGVQTLVPPTSDKAELTRFIQALTPSGNTALYAATTQSAALAQSLTEPRKAIVLLSDGEEFGNVSGGITRDQALAAASASSVPYFVVGLGQVDVTYLTALSEPAGGQLFTTANPEELAALYTRIAERLRVQYTVRFTLPGDLAAGDHKITVSAGGVSGETTLTIAGDAAPASTIALQGLSGELREKTTVSLSNLTSTTRVAWTIDAVPVPGASGTSLELDPYTFAPGSTHTLAAAYDPADPAKRAATTFTVASLPPRLISPTELPNLAPGDLVRLEVEAQPTVIPVAIFLVDGQEVERDTEAPYGFILPPDDYESGEHELSVVLEGAGQRSEKKYEFEGPAGASTNYGAYGIIALAVLAVLAAAGYGGRLAFARYQNRARPVDLSGVGDNLREWAVGRRRGEESTAAPAPAASPEPLAASPSQWGQFVVVSGPHKADAPGRSWPLKDDTELVGRGKFCSVRLKDKGVEEAHFVITREGVLHPSTPSCTVEVNGEAVRTTKLEPGSTVKIGETTLRYDATQPERDA